MIVRKEANGYYYVVKRTCSSSYKASDIKDYRNWFLVKPHGNYSCGIVTKWIKFPKEFLGKKVMFRVELIEEPKGDIYSKPNNAIGKPIGINWERTGKNNEQVKSKYRDFNILIKEVLDFLKSQNLEQLPTIKKMVAMGYKDLANGILTYYGFENMRNFITNLKDNETT